MVSTNKSFFIKSYRDSGNSLYGDIKKLDALGDEARFPWSSCQTFHCNVFILPSWYIDHLFWVSRAIMRAFLNQLNLTRIIKLHKIIHQGFFRDHFHIKWSIWRGLPQDTRKKFDTIIPKLEWWVSLYYILLIWLY